VVVSGGALAEIRNNIGPTSAGNIAAESAFFANRVAGDYRLAPGSVPIDRGADLTATVPEDIEGGSRSNGPPDLGAYEVRVGLPGPGAR
jgi:hypothetical protein